MNKPNEQNEPFDNNNTDSEFDSDLEDEEQELSEDFQSVISKMRKIVILFKHSPVRYEILKEYMKEFDLPVLQLVKDQFSIQMLLHWNIIDQLAILLASETVTDRSKLEGVQLIQQYHGSWQCNAENQARDEQRFAGCFDWSSQVPKL
jgi:hypothetical protein